MSSQRPILLRYLGRMADVIEGSGRHRRPVIIGVHIVLVAIAYLLAFLLRFEFRLPRGARELFIDTLPLLLLVRTAVFAWFHLYEGLWRYVCLRDILGMLKAMTFSSLLPVASVLAIFGQEFPRSIFLLDWVLCLGLVGGCGWF